MSITRVMSADRNASLATAFRVLLPNLLFGLLVIYNTHQALSSCHVAGRAAGFHDGGGQRHAARSLRQAKYEGHPGLWHLLLWVITRFTGDPIAMQVLHLLIALGIWLLIWRVAPFRPFEKAPADRQLLPVLGIFHHQPGLRARRAARLRLHRAPHRPTGAALLALGAARPSRQHRAVRHHLVARSSARSSLCATGTEWRSMIPGIALYAALARVCGRHHGAGARLRARAATKPRLVSTHPWMTASLRGESAFFPFFWPFTPDALHAIGGWGAQLAATPFGGHPAQNSTLLIVKANSPLLVADRLGSPLFACWSIVRDPLRTAAVRRDLHRRAPLRAAMAVSRRAAAPRHLCSSRLSARCGCGGAPCCRRGPCPRCGLHCS